MTTRKRATPLAPGDLEYLTGVFRSGPDGSVQPLAISSTAYLLRHVSPTLPGLILCITDGPRTQDVLYQDLVTLHDGRDLRLAYYPGWEVIPSEEVRPQPDLVGDRLEVLRRLSSPEPPRIVVTTIQALMQRTLAPSILSDRSVHLSLGQEFDLDELTTSLQGMGYSFEAQLGVKGEAALRGGLLDIWPLTESWPVRIEFFGPSVESIRAFDPHEQRSIQRLEDVWISPASEGSNLRPDELGGDLFAYLPETTHWVWLDPVSIRHHAEIYDESIREANARPCAGLYSVTRGRARERRGPGDLAIGPDENAERTDHELGILPIAGLPEIPVGTATPDLLERERRRFIQQLGERRARGERIHFYFSTEGARDRFVDQHQSIAAMFKDTPLHVRRLSEGFHLPAIDLTFITDHDIYGRRKHLRGRYELHARRKGPVRIQGKRIADWTDLKPGELVVHVEHGIGKYLGLIEQETSGLRQEVLAVEYDEGARLFIPVTQSQLLTRYVGVGAKAPRLHKLGGRRWQNEKQRVEKSIRDLAATMLETQAARELREGYAFAPDTTWQHEFEASFPFEETPDQHQAIQDVKQDMERTRPMDRLVCGDVGYGKTEVAMRAAFKAVMNGKQVALLVPTTILAQQHYDSFTGRMEAFPLVIEMLSRFQTRGRQNDVVRRLREGQVDIVIGTHRLIQSDIAFQDLGLLIIDEEQRFGVGQKEFIKQLRQLVDVLTLTATPIPRTLYMSLLGAKEMSTIQSPPQERLPIETTVAPYTDEMVRRAILREINREGQVFFLHNRVKTIDVIAVRLMKLVPEARFAVAHGQMSEHELAAVMRQFVDGQFDVLLCTTIIESGVDIPNVNTIVIDRADRFGLSELYQLRGRVGRYKHRAYAYLLLPRSGALIHAARQRIHALQRYGSLGAGFKLALKDLEIRGTGNLLGSEQSGHITAIGFELYCQFLKRTIAHMKGEKVPPLVIVEMKLDFITFVPAEAEQENAAVIPIGYIDDEDLRVHVYRKLATVFAEPEVDALAEELVDRFGPIPRSVHHLLKMSRARIIASARDIHAIESKGEKIILSRDHDFIKHGVRFPRFSRTDAAGKLDEILEILRKVAPRQDQ